VMVMVMVLLRGVSSCSVDALMVLYNHEAEHDSCSVVAKSL